MRKMPVSQRRARSVSGSVTPPTAGVSIASGAHVPVIDLAALFRDRAITEGLAVAVTGGGVQTTCAVAQVTAMGGGETVALTDGTRITFASADWVRVLDTT
jgi:hypothetical protein